MDRLIVSRTSQAKRSPEPSEIAPPPAPQTRYFAGNARALYDKAFVHCTLEAHLTAIMLAQSAIETGARDALETLLQRRVTQLPDSAVDPDTLDFSFMAAGTRELWHSLTGDSVTAPPRDEWRAYVAHVTRWSRIVGGMALGASPAREALDSWLAVGRFMARLDATMARVDSDEPGMRRRFRRS